MAKFHALKVVDVVRETADSVSIAFEIPEPMRDDYKYIQGQYVTLKLKANGEEIRRSYSLCSSPLEKDFRIAVKRVKNGKGSGYLNELLKPGDLLEVMTPMGNFYSSLDPAHKKHYVFFAGGSGITPVFSNIKTIVQIEQESRITLFYGNLNEESIIFRKKLEELQANSGGKFVIHHILDKPAQPVDALHRGIMSREKVKKLLDTFIKADRGLEYFVCGPTPMMDNVREELEERKINPSNIHIEYFTASLDAAKKKAEPSVSAEKIHSQVTVILYGVETVLEMESTGKSILDTALEAGVDVPFACKGAVCCTCRAKVMEGKVKMDQNFALTESEVEQGFVLTCQSHPLTPAVVVDYDQV